MPPSVFISYSHADEVWKDRLVKQLGVLQQQGLLQTWDDRKIRAGDEWLDAIRKGMNGARVAVLLVSANSLTSNFILHTEVPHLLEKRAQEGLTIFPVICCDCLWQEVPWLVKLQARPRDGKPLESFRGGRLNTELAKIAKEILDIVRDDSRLPQPSERVNETTASVLPSSALAALHQLPSPPGDFTGREEELEALRSALNRSGSKAILGLRGMGGVGKTALAFKFAEDLEDLYPDGQFYLDLQGVTHPLTPAQAMAHVICSYKPMAQLPKAAAELAGLYRSILYGKRVVLLMDNAASREQVEPLLPPKGSMLLMTSRFHFRLPGLFARDLDELPDEDARDLLLKIAPRIGDEADLVAQLCGRLPMALRLAGSALAERPDLTVADYLRRLGEGKERFGSVDASLTLSYELLPEDRRRLWRSLAVFPDTFDAHAVAPVWELEIDPASEALGDMVRSSLVEWEENVQRYRLHDLAKSFADRQLDETERGAAQRRHAEYFLAVLRIANSLYKQGGTSLHRGLRLFDAEWGNIRFGFAWASDRLQEEERAVKICADYPDAGSRLLMFRQHPRERIRWLEVALAAARRCNDRLKEGKHLGNLGAAYADLGELQRAIELYEQGLAIARETGDRWGEGAILNNLGLAYVNLGELRRATKLFEQRLAIAREIGDSRGEGATLSNLGLAHEDLGEPQRAIELYKQALSIAREVGDRRGEGLALGNLGLAYANLGELRRATDLFEQNLEIAREVGDRGDEANTSWSLGLTIEKKGDLARAADLMQVRLDYEREIGHADAEKHAAYVAAVRARIAEHDS